MRITPELRFHRLMDVDESGCWIWNGSRSDTGYPQDFWVDRRRWRPTHWSLLAFRNIEVPTGWQADHLCRVPLCVNPYHLEPVTHAENQRRRAATIVACKHGHRLDEANTYVKPNGNRNCRKCRGEAQKRWRAKQR
jgi:hypothetical protein